MNSPNYYIITYFKVQCNLTGVGFQIHRNTLLEKFHLFSLEEFHKDGTLFLNIIDDFVIKYQLFEGQQ